MKRHGVGQNARIPNSSITTRSQKVDTLRRGNSRNSFPKRFARASDHCAHSGRQPRLGVMTDQMSAFGTKLSHRASNVRFWGAEVCGSSVNWRIVYTSYGY